MEDSVRLDYDQFVVNQKVIILAHDSVTFQKIRELDGITASDIDQSLNCEQNREMVFKAGQNSGQSGSFFFFSRDKKFIIKTMRGDEISTFLRVHLDYHRHLVRNKKSILSRVYGVYTIKMKHLKPVNLVLMQNTMRTTGQLRHVFDLKGSLYKRYAKSGVLKDLNFL